jgi:Icc-related predicted phosphoesterase
LSKTRVFYVTDIHGSDRMFYKFINAAKVYKAQVLIIGGDIAGKTVIPIMQGNGSYSVTVRGTQRTVTSQEDLEAVKKDIRAVGDYAHVTTESDWHDVTSDTARMEKLFDALIAESIESWCNTAEQRLKASNARVIINQGNDDPVIVKEILERSTFVEWPDEKVILIGAHEMMSLGYSNMTPWKLPGDLPEEDLEDKIESLVSQMKNVKNGIFNIHVPPYNTHLDVAPKLDKDLKPVLASGGQPEMVNVGSVAVRRAIEKYQPLVGLHGHIHESRGLSKIGKTICFNPGSEYSVGVLRGAILDFGDDKLESHILTAG